MQTYKPRCTNQLIMLFKPYGMIVCSLIALILPIFCSNALMAQTLLLTGVNGDGGVGCNGRGMCKAVVHSGTVPTSVLGVTSMESQGTLAMSAGRLMLTLTKITSRQGVSIEDIKRFPLDMDAVLPKETAHKLGFSSITLQRGKYDALTPGVFPLQAQFAFGLSVAPTAPSFPMPIHFDVLQPMTVSVIVRNTDGDTIATLAEAQYCDTTTKPVVVWNGITLTGDMVSEGTYSIELRVQLPDGGSFAEIQTVRIRHDRSVGIAQ